MSKLLEKYKNSWSWKTMPAPKELAEPLATSLVDAFITSAPNLNPGLVITTHAILNMNLSESGKVLACKGVGEEVEARVNAGTIRMMLSRYREMKKSNSAATRGIPQF